MNNNPYQVRGPGIRKMLGREQLFKKLCHRLTEHNICVVGPPSFGKSVLLHHLASHFEDTSNHYVIPLYWDLPGVTPLGQMTSSASVSRTDQRSPPASAA